MNLNMELLKERFTAGLERRVTEMLDLASRRNFASLQLPFHSLVGIGGTYGYPEVTRIARDGEQATNAGDVARAMRSLSELDEIRRDLTEQRDLRVA